MLLLILYGAAAGAGALYLAVATINRDLPTDLTAAFDYQPNRKSLVLAADGQEIGAFYVENRQVVRLDRIPSHVIAAFLAAEDSRFWDHPGFDAVGIVRAAWKNFTTGGVKQGASTITQQVTKMLLLDSERTYTRKAKELILAVRIERELSKQEILSIYLNHVFLGNNAYGVAAAAETYFGKQIENVTIAEAALLAGLVAAPSEYAPHRHFDRARTRQVYVLGRMREDGYVSDSEVAAALDEPIAILGEVAENDLAAPYFVEQIRQRLVTAIGERRVLNGGLRIYSTLDPRMQAAAELALRHGLETLDRRLGFRGPVARLAPEARARFADGPPQRVRAGALEPVLGELVPETRYGGLVVELPRKGDLTLDLGPRRLPLGGKDAADARAWRGDDGARLAVGDVVPVKLSADGAAAVIDQAPLIQGALVAIEPGTGRIRALVGGYDWRDNKFDRASQGHRQVGSSIKPFIYGSALAAGYTVVSRVLDGPVAVPTATGVWTPSNYDNRYNGVVTLRTALAKSLNTISVRLMLDVGVDRVIDVLRGFGITSDIPRHISIALGTPDLTLLELAGGYAGIASGGRRVTPRLWDVVMDGRGAPLLDHRADPPGPQVWPPEVDYALVDLMRGVVARGTAKRALELGRPAAGKTGTSANFKDVWFIGFTTDLLCGVWIGRDDSTPIGDKITGGGAAVPIWVEFMKAAHPPTPIRDFPVPAGVVFARAEPWGGSPVGPSASAVWVPFVRGTVPAAFGAGGAGKPFSALVPPLPPP
ncbi:MAG: PBP1A family penicillin-binding protein [Myxococcales bacterium]|nr:PBP1A family penicillin-binding protein [Myxococcales bacterium]